MTRQRASKVMAYLHAKGGEAVDCGRTFSNEFIPRS
jgi:hypothetical protein